MREIKFRAWDTRTNKWCFVTTGEDMSKEEADKNPFPVSKACVFGGNNECIIMQYTGLKDKNGKDIYEGDIVQEDIRRDKRSKPIMRWSVVVYSEKGMFIVECLPKSLRQWNELYKENDEVEVIGNIYENPELLNPHTT